MSNPNDHEAYHHQPQPPVGEPSASSSSSSPTQSLYAMTMPAPPPPAATSTVAPQMQQQPNMSMPPMMMMTAPPTLFHENRNLIPPPIMPNTRFMAVLPSIHTKVSQEEFAHHKKKPKTTEEYYPFEKVTFQPIVTSPKVGDVLTVIRCEEEDTTVNNMQLLPLYIRQHLVQKLKEFIRLYATGAPGCGKTCFFWMWALMKKCNKANGCCWFSIVVPINRRFGFWKTTR
jgi:hypothetical protein